MLVSEAVGRTVHALGGDVVFGLMGSGNLAVTNAIVAAGGRFFSARHETGAVCRTVRQPSAKSEVCWLSSSRGLPPRRSPCDKAGGNGNAVADPSTEFSAT